MNKIADFVREAYAELHKVQWPKKEAIIRLTGYVIGVSVGVGIFVMIFDYIFNEVITVLITG